MKKIYALLTFSIIGVTVFAQPCSDLFFSEYIEGSSSNKALEIYNPTGNTIDLTDYVIYRANNGSLTPTDSLFPQGTVAAGDVFIVGNPGGNPNILAASDTTHSLSFFNGDDAVILINTATGDTLDVVGQVGVDPGSGWPVGAGATNNFTLVRMIGIQEGTADWNVGATEWDVFPIDMTDSLGMHTMTPCGPPPTTCTELFFSEYIEGSSSNKALEIYNPTAATIDLTDYVIYRANNGSLTPTDSLFPQGTVAAGDVFVIGNPGANATILAESDTTHSLTFYNGDDAVWLYNTATADTLDIIGIVGVDPGSGWVVGTGATNNTTLVRMITVQEGTTDWALSVTQWDVHPIDEVNFLGSHTMNPCGTPVTPIVQFSTGSQSVNENVGSVTVEVAILNPDAVNPTSVDVVLGVSTATNGADFNYTSPTTVTFPAGSSANETIAITITDDVMQESTEDIVLELQNPTNSATLGNDSIQTISITDNDAPANPCADLFFSEYIEGSSNNKVLEIYNPTPGIVDLSEYSIRRYNNGATSPSGTLNMTGLLVPGDVYVIANPSADSVLLAIADLTHSITFYNGDDALELVHDTTVIDAIGVVGVDPGTNWPVGAGATSENTLVRNITIQEGNTIWTGSADQEYDVYPQNDFNFIGFHDMNACGPIPLTAFYTPIDDTVCVGDSVHFTNLSYGGQAPYTYGWDFGDGNNSTDMNPSHAYASAGSFNVTLTVTDNNSATNDTTFTVVVNAAPTVAYAAPSSGCAPLMVTYNGTTDFGTTFSWDYDCDNVIDTSGTGLTTVSQTYNTPGSYITCLTVTSPDGCASTYIDSVEVFDVPTAGFTSSTSQLQAIFTNTSIGGTIYVWDFGDGNTSTAQDPTHTYTADGTYTVCLTVTNAGGCSDTICDSVTVIGTGIIVAPEHLNVALYPNPTSGLMTLQNDNITGTADLQVYNVMGQQVVQQQVQLKAQQNITLDFTTLPVGNYTITLTGDFGRVAQQINVLR